MTIYDKLRMRIRTWTEGLNVLFDMGSELEGEVNGLKGGIVKDVTLTEVDKHYTLTILYDDNTSDTVNWDDSTVGIEDITLTYNDGVYVLTIILEDGSRYNFSIPVGNVVTEEELTTLNLGTPNDSASSTGSLWARVKNAVSRIGILETSDTNNVKKTGTSVVTGDIQVPTPVGNTSVVNKSYTDNKRVIMSFNGADVIDDFLDYLSNVNVGDRIIGTRLRDSSVTGMGIQDFEFTVSSKSTSSIVFMGNAIGIRATGSVNANNCYCSNITLTLSTMSFTTAYLDTSTNTTKYDLIFLGGNIDTLTSIDIIHYN